MERTVERWGCFEASARGKTEGNPFVDAEIFGEFTGEHEHVRVGGFYDGEGIYRVRFMPLFEGRYDYRLYGSALDEPVTGAFLATAPSENNHGPARISGFHFEYEDGTRLIPLGTTCYAWTHQTEELYQQTLRTLATAPFRKIRFCIFPKHYLYNLHEPATYPYEGTPCAMDQFDPETLRGGIHVLAGNRWDFTRFRPDHFRRIDRAIQDLQRLGIEADLIVMHPYDRWGFSCMSKEQDDLYWRYVIARFAAYRNVWWSLANEYDLMTTKTTADWERYASLLLEGDPYHHPRSIHNCREFYDHTRPWITHCSLQRQDYFKCAELTDQYRTRFGKPVVLDELAYEGNLDQGWGNITAQEMVRRCWEGAVRGGYPGHGETYDRPDGVLWWSHGGALHGESPARIAFLMEILRDAPGRGLCAKEMCWDCTVGVAEGAQGYYLYYFDDHQPAFRSFDFGPDARCAVDVIDTWNMTIDARGELPGKFRLELPGRPYMAVRIRVSQPDA